MCDSSVVADDWVVKGCHIHIEDVELSINPDHLGGFVFQQVFSSTPDAKVAQAIKLAREKCLPDPRVRKQWIRNIEHATTFMESYTGALQSFANGRKIEFKFLILALKRYQ